LFFRDEQRPLIRAVLGLGETRKILAEVKTMKPAKQREVLTEIAGRVDKPLPGQKASETHGKEGGLYITPQGANAGLIHLEARQTAKDIGELF
jgi:hypothetical protein